MEITSLRANLPVCEAARAQSWPHLQAIVGEGASIAVSSETDGDWLVLASHLRKYMNDAPHEQSPSSAAERVAIAEIYERALKITLQVIVER